MIRVLQKIKKLIFRGRAYVYTCVHIGRSVKLLGAQQHHGATTKTFGIVHRKFRIIVYSSFVYPPTTCLSI